MSNCPTTGVPTQFCTCVQCQKPVEPVAASQNAENVTFNAMREPAWARVQREQTHECLYRVAGPCSHPKCLEARYRELVAAGSPP